MTSRNCAIDDGGGALISWQVLSTLRQLKIVPKRTIRLVMWSCEEFGAVCLCNSVCFLSVLLYVYVCMYVCMCMYVCVCVCVCMCVSVSE